MSVQCRRRTGKLAPADHAVHHAILHGLVRIHYVIAIDIALDSLQRLARGLRQNLVQNLARPQDLARLDIEIGGLPSQALRVRHLGGDKIACATKLVS